MFWVDRGTDESTDGAPAVARVYGSSTVEPVASSSQGSGPAMIAGNVLAQEVGQGGLSRLSLAKPGAVLWTVPNGLATGPRDGRSWIATKHGVYWTDGGRVHLRQESRRSLTCDVMASAHTAPSAARGLAHSRHAERKR